MKLYTEDKKEFETLESAIFHEEHMIERLSNREILWNVEIRKEAYCPTIYFEQNGKTEIVWQLANKTVAYETAFVNSLVLSKKYPAYTSIEYFELVNPEEEFEPDNLSKLAQIDVSGLDYVISGILCNETDYNEMFMGEGEIHVDFETWHGNKDARVYCMILDRNYIKEKFQFLKEIM